MSTIVALIAGYFALLAILSLIARPYRARLAELIDQLGSDYGDYPDILAVLQRYADTCYIWRSATIKFVGYVLFLMVPGSALDKVYEKTEQDQPFIFSDPRFREMISCYNASISAVNPIFGALMFAVREIFLLKARIHHRGKSVRKLSDLIGMKAIA